MQPPRIMDFHLGFTPDRNTQHFLSFSSSTSELILYINSTSKQQLTLNLNVCRFIKSHLYQCGFVCTMVTVLLYPYYLQFVELTKTVLGSYYSETTGFVFILSLTHIITYSTWNGFFGICDLGGFLQQYKLGRRPYMIPKKALVLRTLAEAAVGQLIVGPVILYYSHDALVRHGLKPLQAPLPSNWDLFTTFTFAGIFNGFFFYWAHRSFHSKLLYSTFHKQHHEYTGAIGICAEYAGTVEQLVANIGPSLGGVLFFGCQHPLVVFVWLVCMYL